MKDVITALLLQTGTLLTLPGPLMAYAQVPLWGAPMVLGILILIMALIHNNEAK